MLNLPRFLKRFLRRYTRPKTPGSALQKRTKISLFYAFITWNLLGLAVYTYNKKRAQESSEGKVSDGRYFAELLGIKNATVKRFSGLTKVGEWDLEEEKRIHGRLLTDKELEQLAEGQQLEPQQGGTQQQQESGWNKNYEFDSESESNDTFKRGTI